MQFYDRETLECELYNAILSKKYDPSGSAVAMDYFSTIWGRNIPWIYYTDTLSMWKQRTDLNLKISKQWSDDGPSDGDHLSLILSSYFRNGTWKEFLEVSDELQLCKGAISDSQAWKIPTTNFVNSCKLHSSTLETVLQFHEDTLYELFLLDENKSLYPIPVKQTKVQNSDFIQTGDQSLSRRFFLAQNMSTSGTHWLCANEIRLDLYLTPSGVLQPPIMHIDYTRVSDLRSSKHHSVSFKLSYRSHPPVSALFRSHFRTAIVASIVSTLFIGLALILREARARQPRALTTNFFCFAIACLSNVLSLTLTATLIHIVVFFWLFGVHFRSDFKILAADSEEFEHSVLSIAIGALVSRILSVAYSVYQQVTYDLYFIDWENPRRIIDFESGMEINAPVSCWRRLLVANEWNELETRRRHPVHHTILLVILLLEGIATWRGVTEDLYREESGIIRLGRVLAVYALVLCGQLIWNRIESTCIKENPLSQFVDLLFISNISCLMMDTSFSGYYLHGRNQNLHSDVSLKELNDSLVQEHHGLLAQRGLSLLNNQDHQVFNLQGSTNGRELDQEKSWTPRTPLSALNSQKLEFSPETLIQKMIREIENNISEQVADQIEFSSEVYTLGLIYRAAISDRMTAIIQQFKIFQMSALARNLTRVGSQAIRSFSNRPYSKSNGSFGSSSIHTISSAGFVGTKLTSVSRLTARENKFSMSTSRVKATTATIAVGDKLPDGKFNYFDAEGNMKDISVEELCAGKKVVLFAVPGAFTPTCSLKHLPGFIEKSDELKAAGVDTIACIAVNDAFVMDAWGKSIGAADKILMLADGSALFTQALGVQLDLTDKGLGLRSRRYAMVVDDMNVKVLKLEEGGAFTLSSAEDILSEI
eukprot:g8709.t1